MLDHELAAELRVLVGYGMKAVRTSRHNRFRLDLIERGDIFFRHLRE